MLNILSLMWWRYRRRNEEIENKQRDAQLAPKEANRASSYAYSRNPPANEQTEEKKQNILCVLDSSKNSACYRCLVHGLPRLPWRLARLPRARIRSTEKMAEGIKPDNVICLVTPGSARQDFLNSEVACNFNLHANNLFKWLFLRTTSTSNSMVIFGFWYNFKDIWHGLFFLSQERIRNLANTNWHLTLTLFLFARTRKRPCEHNKTFKEIKTFVWLHGNGRTRKTLLLQESENNVQKNA